VYRREGVFGKREGSTGFPERQKRILEEKNPPLFSLGIIVAFYRKRQKVSLISLLISFGQQVVSFGFDLF